MKTQNANMAAVPAKPKSTLPIPTSIVVGSGNPNP
jgi:hypothetical protein